MSSSGCHSCLAVLLCFAAIERVDATFPKLSAALGDFYGSEIDIENKVARKLLSEESVDLYSSPQKPVFLGTARSKFVHMIYNESGSCSESNTSFFLEPAILSVAEAVTSRGPMPTTSPVQADAEALPETEHHRGVETAAAQLDMLITHGRHREAVRESRHLRPMSPVFPESAGGRAFGFTIPAPGPRPVPLVKSLRELHIGSPPSML